MASILLDSCVWGWALPPLRAHGHDVEWTGSLPKDPGDKAILAYANLSRRILVTLDKDLGELAILKGMPRQGIIRLSGFRAGQLAPTIHHIITQYQKDLETCAIITADPKKIRVRSN